MRRRSRSRGTVAATAIVVGAAAAAAALVLRLIRMRTAPRDEQATTAQGNATAPPPENSASDVQEAADGVGPLRHRHYEVRVVGSTYSATSLLHAIERHLSELSPSSLAEFAKSVGDNNRMQVDDEYTITMLGPWNGRVRVSEVTSNTFTLVTCEGHPEAGHIVFRVTEDVRDAHALQIEIDSYARSRDATVELAYGTLKVGQQVQTEVWVTFLQRVAELAGMTTVPEVQVTTEELVD